MKTVPAVVKRLLISDKISFIVTFLVAACATSSGNVVLSHGNFTWLLALLSPFFFVFHDFHKMLYVGTSKSDYFHGCIIGYIIISFLISSFNTIIYCLIDPIHNGGKVINIMDICNWTDNNILIAALQQMAFLLCLMIFLHMLLSMQDRWYGWLADLILIAIICIFTPIASLRVLLSGFFKLVMLNSKAFIQISLCLVLSTVSSCFTFLILGHKVL